MTHKTITISEKTYKALERLKGKDESINDVISRFTNRMNLLEYIEATDFSEELVDKLEAVYNERRKVAGREVKI